MGVLCLGELLIDFVPTEAGLGLSGTPTFRKAAGGAPANVAVGLARLGVPAAFAGKVGDDGFGRFLRDTLAAAGVDTGPLRITRDAQTTLAFVSLAPDGEREFLFYRDPGADTLLDPADIDEAAVAAAQVLHYGSLSLTAEPARAATLRAVDLAIAHDVWRSYDPNLREALWPGRDAARDGMRLGLRHAEIVKISVEEVEFLTGDPDPSRGVRALWHDALRLVAVTAGSAGSTWFTADAEGTVPGFAVTPVDTTGAGDAFMAALLAALLAEPSALADPPALDRLLRTANAAGALATTVRGAIPAMPTRAAIDALLAKETA